MRSQTSRRKLAWPPAGLVKCTDWCRNAHGLGTPARVGTALADPARRRVLVHLTSGPEYPAEMAQDFGNSRANLSNHLACLRECGLAAATAEGRRIRYELADQRLADALRICRWRRRRSRPGRPESFRFTTATAGTQVLTMQYPDGPVLVRPFPDLRIRRIIELPAWSACWWPSAPASPVA